MQCLVVYPRAATYLLLPQRQPNLELGLNVPNYEWKNHEFRLHNCRMLAFTRNDAILCVFNLSKNTVTYETAVLMFFAPPAMAGFETKSYIAQSLLNALGYNVGSIDGFWGKNTKAALVAYLEKMGATFEGELTEEHLVYLENSYTKIIWEIPSFRKRRY